MRERTLERPGAAAERSAGRWAGLAQIRRGIAPRLLLSVLLFSSAVTLVLTIVELYLDYRYEVSLIDSRLDEIEKGYPGIIAESLWRLDKAHIEIALNGIRQLPALQFVEVRETNTADALVVTVGQRGTGSLLAREIPIYRVIRGSEQQQIGVLHVEATLSGVYSYLLNRVLIILVGQGAKTFLVSLFIIYIFHWLVTRHLITIAEFVRGYDFRRPSAPLRLIRKMRASPDELDQVVASLNELCSSLQSAYGDLQRVNAELERDIAERKISEMALRDSEQRYKHLFHNMPVALLQVRGGPAPELVGNAANLTQVFEQDSEAVRLMMDAFVVEEVNNKAVALFSASDARELIGPATRIWKNNPDTFRRALESRHRGETSFEEELKLVLNDGRSIDVHCTISRPQPISHSSPSLVGLVDISERARARERLRQLEADFAHAARVSMLGELTASIAHEVSQPVAAIAMSGEASLRWLDRPEPNVTEVRTLARRVVADARRAADIIARIREMAVRREPERGAVSLDEVIHESLLFLRNEIEGSAVTVVHRPNPAAPKVLANRTQLQQVIVNLTINAIQAVAPLARQSRKIVVSAAAADPGMARCAIEDAGNGIEAGHMDRLFSSFFTTKAGGMGMGLSISRSIIEDHGGRIVADNDSILGGARFWFTLPIASDAAR
jgi:signal transduction histidine kinase